MQIIFHAPFPLVASSGRASQIRPFEMKKAFEDLGCQVDAVTGYAAERKQGVAKIRKNIARGTRYQLLYSESSTMPTLLTEPHHFPISPSIDFGLWRTAHTAGIKIGVFYRDIYWRFPEYDQQLGRIKSSITKFFYRYDLKQYQRYATKVYVPSQQMQSYIPIVDPQRFQPLPPAHNRVDTKLLQNLTKGRLNLFYVGGLGNHYRMHKLIEGIGKLPQVQLVICTREAEWQSVANEFGTLTPNIRVVHKQGNELEELFLQTNINLLFFEPSEYRDFAMPLKLFDYIGSGRPIIATRGTLSAELIEQQDIGWTIPYDTSQLINLLQQLVAHPEQILQKTENVAAIAPQHHWRARAKQVLADLQ